MIDPRRAVAEGNDHHDQGRYEQALEAYDAAPDDPEALKAKANVLMVLDRTDEAVTCYDRLIELSPNDSVPLSKKAAFVSSLGRYEEAIELYDQAVHLAPNEAAIHRDRAIVLQLDGQYDAALDSYDRSLEIDDGDADAWGGKADVLIELERYSEAMACLNKAAEAPEGNFESFGWTDRGYSMMAADAFDEALHCFDRAIQRDPNDGVAYLGKASALEAEGDVDAALVCYDRAIQLRPDDVYALLLKGNALFNSRQVKEALACYDSSLTLNPNDSICWTYKASCLSELNRHESALEAYDKAIEIDPQDAVAWDGKGTCLKDLGRPREALQALERALDLDPDLWTVNNNLGFVLSRYYRENERALIYFNRAIELSEREALPYANKAESLAEMGRAEEARILLEEAMESVDDRNNIFHTLAYVYGDYLDDKRKAIDCYEQAEQLHPGNQIRLLGISELLIRLSRYEESRDRISLVLEMELEFGDRCVARFLRFASYALEGQLDDARTCFEEFFDCLRTKGDECGGRPPADLWNYDALVREIAHHSVSIETKFILLVAIDLQLGRLVAPSLSELSHSLPLATAPPTGSEHDAERTDTHSRLFVVGTTPVDQPSETSDSRTRLKPGPG